MTTITSNELLRLPEGAEVTRTSEGWVVTTMPELTEREQLAAELQRVVHVDTPVKRVRSGSRWLDLADYIERNFTRNEQRVPPAPIRVIDGDGDTWYLQENGCYSPLVIDDSASATLEDINRFHGINYRVHGTPPPPPVVAYVDRSGDRWERQSNNRYSIRWRSQGWLETEDPDFCERTLEDVRREWGPLTPAS